MFGAHVSVSSGLICSDIDFREYSDGLGPGLCHMTMITMVLEWKMKFVLWEVCTVVSSYPPEECSKTFNGRLKLWIVLNPYILCGFCFPIHTYL